MQAYNYESIYGIAIEPKSFIKYNLYRSKMADKNEDLREQFAEARAIYFAMLHGAITTHQAKLRTAPLIRKINSTIKKIATEYRVKPTYITFYDLGKSI